VISGTIFEATKRPLTVWFLAMHLLTQSKNNVSAWASGLERAALPREVPARRRAAQLPLGEEEEARSAVSWACGK
jgi:hypothetical protein